MSEIYCLVECLVVYNNGSQEVRRPTFTQITIGMPSVNTPSVINYIKEGLNDVKEVRIIDVLYFTSKAEFDNYNK